MAELQNVKVRLYLWKKGIVFLKRFFGISQSGSTMKIEVLAGITTFITIAIFSF